MADESIASGALAELGLLDEAAATGGVASGALAELGISQDASVEESDLENEPITAGAGLVEGTGLALEDIGDLASMVYGAGKHIIKTSGIAGPGAKIEADMVNREAIRNAPETISTIAKNVFHDPHSVTNPLLTGAATVAGGLGAAALTTASTPIWLTGLVVGSAGYGANFVARTLLDAAGLDGSDLGVDKSTGELVKETTRETLPDLLALGAAKTGKVLTRAADPLETGLRGAFGRRAQGKFKKSLDERSPQKLREAFFAESADARQAEAVKDSMDILGEEIGQKVIDKWGPDAMIDPATSLKDYIAGPRVPRKGTFGRPVRGGGFLDDAAEDVRVALSASDAQFSFDRVQNLVTESFPEGYFSVGGENAVKAQSLRSSMLRPYYKKLAKKAGVADSLDIDKRFRQASEYHEKGMALDKLETKIAASSEADLKSVKKLKTQKAVIEKEREILKKSMDEADELLSTARLDSNDMMEVYRQAVKDTKFSSGEITDPMAASVQFKANLNKAIDEGLEGNSAGLQALRDANDRYFAAASILEWLDPIIISEMRTIDPNNFAILEAVRFQRDIRFGNTPHKIPSAEKFRAALTAPGGASAFSTYMLRGLPKANSVADMFTPARLVAVNRLNISLSEALEGVNDPMAQEEVSGLLSGTQQIQAVVEQGRGLPESQQRLLLKPLYKDPHAVRLLPPRDTGELLAGVDSLFGKPMSAEDDARFRMNLKNSDLGNLEKARIEDNLNRGRGITQPRQKERELKTSVLNSLEDGPSRDFGAIRGSKKLVEASTMKKLLENSNEN